MQDKPIHMGLDVFPIVFGAMLELGQRASLGGQLGCAKPQSTGFALTQCATHDIPDNPTRAPHRLEIDDRCGGCLHVGACGRYSDVLSYSVGARGSTYILGLGYTPPPRPLTRRPLPCLTLRKPMSSVALHTRIGSPSKRGVRSTQRSATSAAVDTTICCECCCESCLWLCLLRDLMLPLRPASRYMQ